MVNCNPVVTALTAFLGYGLEAMFCSTDKDGTGFDVPRTSKPTSSMPSTAMLVNSVTAGKGLSRCTSAHPPSSNDTVSFLTAPFNPWARAVRTVFVQATQVIPLTPILTMYTGERPLLVLRRVCNRDASKLLPLRPGLPALVPPPPPPPQHVSYRHVSTFLRRERNDPDKKDTIKVTHNTSKYCPTLHAYQDLNNTMSCMPP